MAKSKMEEVETEEAGTIKNYSLMQKNVLGKNQIDQK